MAGQVGACTVALRPLHDLIASHVLAPQRLHGDDTPVPALATQLADERESLLWGYVNMLDAQTRPLDRAADKLMPELRDLQREQDGTEIKSCELELITDRARNLADRRDAFEQMRDTATDAYRVETGEVWRPRRGSHVSQTGRLTSAAIDARDFQRARKDRKTMAHLPQGIHDPLDRLDGSRAGAEGERGGEQVSAGKHRVTFGEMGQGPVDRRTGGVGVRYGIEQVGLEPRRLL